MCTLAGSYGVKFSQYSPEVGENTVNHTPAGKHHYMKCQEWKWREYITPSGYQTAESVTNKRDPHYYRPFTLSSHTLVVCIVFTFQYETVRLKALNKAYVYETTDIQ